MDSRRPSLLVFNPSRYSRGGWVTVPWGPIAKETGFGQDDLLLYQDSGTPLFYQVDQIDPSDPSHDTLSFFLSRQIDPGDEHYQTHTGEVFIEGRPSSNQARRQAPAQVRDYELSNNRLDVRLNLSPESEDKKGYWYAGSARSVRLEKLRDVEDGQAVGPRREFLDFINFFYLDHDPEKRCMQLESIRISQLDRRFRGYQHRYLHDQPYRLVSECYGPVRRTVTIASEPFYFSYSAPPAPEAIPLRCELYRVFSLYEDREYVVEELFIKATPPDNFTGAADFNLLFEARYFTYLKIGQPQLFLNESVPDWFAIGDPDGPLVYGFACDVHVSRAEHPDPKFPVSDNRWNSFSWILPPSKTATCLHLFSKHQPTDFPSDSDPLTWLEELANQATQWFTHQAGHAWYEIIYKPLYAELAAGRSSLPRGSV
ncbi:MAG TPA: hypothetical protein VJ715_16715 [Pyrinomonadaceae bacterium]|nr:hypothetical protein [Pyrinomonadaceae bacterium]